MTPCEKKGYKVGDKFIVEFDCSFSKGSIVRLAHDDGSMCPMFELIEGYCSFFNFGGKSGGFMNIKNIREVTAWSNGDECVYNGELYVYQCVASWDSDACILSGKSRNSHSLTDAWIEELSKPEAPQQREERERLEAAYDLYCTGNDGVNVTMPCAFDGFKSDGAQCKFWLAIVDKTGYRKAK